MKDWKSKQLAYDGSDNVIYKGYNFDTNAPDSYTNWEIHKLTYDSGNMIKEQISEGTWTDRASLNW
jgi:hypothetical protein